MESGASGMTERGVIQNRYITVMAEWRDGRNDDAWLENQASDGSCRGVPWYAPARG